jgi:hypothetical protein
LGCRQADAFVFEHNLGHFVHEATDILIDCFNRLGTPGQDPGRIMRDFAFVNIHHLSNRT